MGVAIFGVEGQWFLFNTGNRDHKCVFSGIRALYLLAHHQGSEAV